MRNKYCLLTENIKYYLDHFCDLKDIPTIDGLDKKNNYLYMHFSVIDHANNASKTDYYLKLEYDYDYWSGNLQLHNLPNFFNIETQEFKKISEYMFDAYEFERVDQIEFDEV